MLGKSIKKEINIKIKTRSSLFTNGKPKLIKIVKNKNNLKNI